MTNADEYPIGHLLHKVPSGRELAEVTAERDSLMRMLERSREFLREVDALIAESHGVIGMHLNGDTASWDEILGGGRFERVFLESFREAISVGPDDGNDHAHDPTCHRHRYSGGKCSCA